MTLLFPLTFASNERETTTGFVTVRLRATSHGEGRRRELDFRRGPTAPGQRPPRSKVTWNYRPPAATLQVSRARLTAISGYHRSRT
jgi:hypothetical protein